MFSAKWLKVTSWTTIAAILDVILNHSEPTYQLCQKPNAKIIYSHKKWNHLPTLIKQLLVLIETGFSKISSNKKEFHLSISFLQMRFNHKMECQTRSSKNKQKRQKKWVFSRSVYLFCIKSGQNISKFN